jgi:4-hydroxythreonine-4-phosphate dehydrogenase
MSSHLPVIGLMLGDVTGIGPELCAKILASGKQNHLARIVVFGDARVLELGMQDAGVRFSYSAFTNIDDVRWPRSDVPLVDLKNIDPAQFERGAASAESGRLTGETLKTMIDAAVSGKSTASASRRSTRGRSTAAAGNSTTSTRCSRS